MNSSFPIADFNDSLIERKPGDLLPTIAKSKLFWIGFLLLLIIRINNGLCVWYPDYYIPVRLSWSLSPFASVWPELFRVPYGASLLNLSFFPLVVAFAFFLSTEISLTLGYLVCWVWLCPWSRRHGHPPIGRRLAGLRRGLSPCSSCSCTPASTSQPSAQIAFIPAPRQDQENRRIWACASSSWLLSS